MMTGALAAGLGAAGSVVGGLLSGSGGSSTTQSINWGDYRKQQRLDRENQMLINQNQPSWIVEGARRAGLHPLAVLGGNMTSGSTHFVGSGTTSSGGGRDYSWLKQAGQGIGRAAGALLSQEDRAKQAAYDEANMALDLENKKLQNEQIQTQINATKYDMVSQLARNAERSLISTGQTPGFQVGVDGRTTRSTIAGQNDARSSRLFTVKPPELAMSHPDTPAAEAGTHPELRYMRTSDGGYAPIRSQTATDALEDDLIGGINWAIRNNLMPASGITTSHPPDAYKRKGERWTYSLLKGAWYAKPRTRFSDMRDYISKRYHF